MLSDLRGQQNNPVQQCLDNSESQSGIDAPEMRTTTKGVCKIRIACHQ